MTISTVNMPTTSQYTITTGNELLVVAGGVVSSAAINAGGTLSVNGGIESTATVALGGVEIVSAGSATGDLIYGALSNVSGVAGHLTSEVVENGGVFTEVNSGIVTGTIVESGGTFRLNGNTSGANTNTTVISGGVVQLQSAKATLGGTLTFSGGYNSLQVSATTSPTSGSSSFGDQAVIGGFSSTDVIDLQTLASSTSLVLTVTTSGGNTVATVTGGGSTDVADAFIFSGTTTYTSTTLALAADANKDAEIVYVPGGASTGTTTSITTSTAPGAETVSSGNTLVVATGGSVSGATVASGGHLVLSGGSDAAAVISSGGTETVSTGSAGNDLIYGAATVSGGAVTSETVENGGALTVASGGAVTSTTISAGGSATIAGGSATGDLIYGTLSTVSGDAGLLTSETVENGGVLVLANANSATSTTVLGGGTLNISGADTGATATLLDGGATVELTSPKALINGVLTFANGGNTLEVTSLTTTSAGTYGEQAVITGFTSTDEIAVTALGVGITSAITTGNGNTSATLTGSLGSETFIFAGTSTYTNNTLVVTSSAGAVDLKYNPNPQALTVSAGATSNGLTVSSGVTLNVQSGGTVSATTVLSAGIANISGADVSATISEGGTETVYGSATGDQIAGGVTVNGSATGETVLAGGAIVINGGADTSATISVGGSETLITGTATGDQIYGGATIAGGTLAGATVHGGASVTVNSGALASATVQSGGSVTVNFGLDTATTVLAGGNESFVGAAASAGSAFGDQIYGTQLISASAGIATSETVYSGGVVDLFLKGGVVLDMTVDSGGVLNISGNATATNLVLSGGGTVDLQSPKPDITGTLTFAGGGNVYELTSATTTSAGNYGDQAVISGFSSTDAIWLTAAAYTGSALTLSQSVSGGDTVVDVLSAGTQVDAFTFSGTTLDGYFALISDQNGGEYLETPPVSVTTSVTTSTASAYTEDATDTLLILADGSVSGATIDKGGFLTVSGGVDSGAIVQAGGLETVSAGSASGDQIYGSAVVGGGTVVAETVLSGGQLSVASRASVANVVLSGGGVVDLASPTATLSGTVTFVSGGNTLRATAIAGAGYGDQAVINGFSSADKVDVAGIAPTGATLTFTSDGAGDAVATISGGGVSESLLFNSPATYNSGTMSLIADGSGGVDLILDTTPVVTITTSGGRTNAATDIVNGTVDTSIDPEAIGTTVTIFDGSAAVASATVGADGQWSAKVTFANDAGANVLTASDTDVAGNTGVTSQAVTYTVNTTAAAFVPGDLVVSLSGDADGSGSYGDNAASPVTLDELTTTGQFVGQIVLPQTATVVNGVTTEYAISSEYGSQSEGSLQLSGDGHSLVIAGYGVNDQTYNNAATSVYGGNALAQSQSVTMGPYTVVPRVVADINADGVVDTSTALTGVFNENNPRSVTTIDGTAFWLSGQGLKGDTTQGVKYALDGATTATIINDATDTRTAEIYNGVLYVSADSTQGAENISSYGALPTSATSPTVLTGLSGAIVLTAANANTANAGDVGQSVYLSPENFFFANANTLYVADSGNPKEGGIGDGGLQKWTFNGSTWTLAYTLSSGLDLVPGTAAYGTSGLIGLTGKVVGASVQLYATSYNLTDIEPTYVYSITDQLGATTNPGETFSTIYTAPTGSNVRGIAFAPTGYAPTIAGTVVGQTTTSEAVVTPFAGVTLGDQNSNAVDTVTITVGGTGGTLSGTGLSGGTGGVYTLSGTAAAAASELDALSFTPTAGQANTTSKATFELSDQSSAYATPTVDTATTVIDTDPAVAPTISGTAAGQSTTSEAPVTPFSGVTITDANDGATDTLTITFSGGGGVLSGATFASVSGDVYTLSGAAADVTSALDGLSFTPTAATPNGNATTTFTLSDQSSAYSTPTVDATTTVVDSDPGLTPQITVPTARVIGEGVTTVVPGVALSQAGALPGETFTVNVSDAIGVLTAAGSGVTGSGTSSLTASGSLAQISSVLSGLTVKESTAGTDTIAVAASDSYGDVAIPAFIAIRANGAPVSTAPASVGTIQNIAQAISGLTVMEAGNTAAESFTTVLTDATGLLTATGSGVTGSGTTDLTISGSLAQVRSDLATVKVDEASVGTDTLSVSTSDSLGNSAPTVTTAITTVTPNLDFVSAPSSLLLGAGAAGSLTGVSLSYGVITTGRFTVKLADTSGLIAVTGKGITGSRTPTVTITGTLAQVNADLATLKVTEAAEGADTLTITAADPSGVALTPASVAVTVNGKPTLTLAGTPSLVQGKASLVSGLVAGESGVTDAETFTTKLTDTKGLLAVTASGAASVTGSGTPTLLVSGSLTDVNATLATLTDTEGQVVSDTLHGTVTDSLGVVSTALKVSFPVAETFDLTTGTDRFVGGAANDAFVATGGALSAGDVLVGGTKTNVLELQGAGTFDLTAPTVVSKIATIDAQELQPATGVSTAAGTQTVDLRAGMNNVTVNVAGSDVSLADPNPTSITIVGAANNDVIDLASGNDTVVVGSKLETVKGGAGVDTIQVTGATIGATINGGSSGDSTLAVTGGGTVTMGASVTNIATVDLDQATKAYRFTANAIAGLVVDDLSTTGSDTITAGAAGQILEGGAAGKATFVGFSTGVTVFENSAANFNADTIRGFNSGDLLEFDGLAASGATVAYSAASSSRGTLSVKDNGVLVAQVTLFGQVAAGAFSAEASIGGTVIVDSSASSPQLTSLLSPHA